MHGEQVGTGESRGAGRSAHLMRDVVELQVEEDLETALVELTDDGGPLGVEQRHADLQPGGMAGERIGKLDGAVAVAIDRNDDAVAGIGL